MNLPESKASEELYGFFSTAQQIHKGLSSLVRRCEEQYVHLQYFFYHVT